jgi:aminopeptidase N
MWIHESFTNYSESLFVEYYYGKEAGNEYVRGIRKNIQNDKPIIGHYDVNNEGSSDMYYKGANMLHTIRQILNDDDKWRSILRGLNSTFYHQTVTTKQIEDYLTTEVGIDLSTVFNQYLRDTRIPTLEYYFKDQNLGFRWSNCVSGFNMPVKVTINGKEMWLKPKTDWEQQTISIENPKLEIDKNFYVARFNITE